MTSTVLESEKIGERKRFCPFCGDSHRLEVIHQVVEISEDGEKEKYDKYFLNCPHLENYKGSFQDSDSFRETMISMGEAAERIEKRRINKRDVLLTEKDK